MNPESTTALKYLQRHGVDPISWQTLEAPFQYWWDAEGYVGYVDTGTAWVAAGPPVGPPAELDRLARGFVAAAKAAARRAIFFGATPDSIVALGGKPLRIGVRPYWNPQHWDLAKKSSSFRYQLHRAENHGVKVRRLAAEELQNPQSSLRRQIDHLAADWLDRRAMAPMGFIVSLELYVYPEHHAYFVAEREGEVIGFLSAVPVFVRRGWFVEDILRFDHAPNGTGELLVQTFFDWAKREGSQYVTLGLMPLAGELSLPLRLVRTLSRPLFNFVGLARFKSKLRPDGYEPRYIGGADTGSVRSLWEVLSAFSRVGIVRFLFATVGRGSVTVVALLTLLLILWVPLLTLAPTEVWFPSRWIHRSWVVFDVFLAVGLISLCRRYRHPLAVGLATVVTADATLTVVQALEFNLWKVSGVLQSGILIGACLGPIAGAAALWSVVVRQARRRRIA